MTVSTRSYLIAGMAALSAGAIAVAPVQPVSQDLALAPQQVSSLAVGLAASIDPITPWIDTFQATADNISGLFTSWASAPLPIIQQVVANQLTYLGELPDIGLIISQVVGNIGNAITAPFQADLNTLDEPHQLAWQLLPQIAPTLTGPLIDFTTSSLTGILLGLVGPVVAPVLQLVDSVSSIISALGDSDFTGALNDLINIPANLVNAFLNGGQTLDLTGIISAIGIELPAALAGIGLTFGGLLSPGGSAFNSLQLVAQIAPPPFPSITIPGAPAGALGSLIGLTQAVAGAIAVTPPNSSAAVAKVAAAEAPAALAEAPAALAEAPAADVEAPAAEVAVTSEESEDAPVATAYGAADVTAEVSDDLKRDTESAAQDSGRGTRAKAGRSASGDASPTGQDAPARSGKAGASRAG